MISYMIRQISKAKLIEMSPKQTDLTRIVCQLKFLTLEHKGILDNNLGNSLLKCNKTFNLLNNLETFHIIKDKMSLKGVKIVIAPTTAPILYFQDLLNSILEAIQEAFNLVKHQCPINSNFKLNKKRIRMLIKCMYKH